MTRSVIAVVPARDEADVIAWTLEALLTFCQGCIVVDDGSRDATAARAGLAGARVIWSGRPRGKGAAATAGVRAVPDLTDVVLLADADLGSSAAGLGVLVDELDRGDADLIIGAFPPLAGGGFGMVKRAAGEAIQREAGITVAEPLSGQRAMPLAVARRLTPFAAGFGMETRMTIDAVRAGYRVLEVPIEANHRPTGRGIAGFAHRGRQGLDIARAVSQARRGHA